MNENRAVREPDLLRPRLRAGLHFALRRERGVPVCLIEDTQASRFHRVGLEEMRFLRALDGRRPLAAIVAQLARDGSGHTFTESEALQIVRWAREQGLLAVESAHDGDTGREKLALHQAATWLNPLMLKLPLARPDRFFAAAARGLRTACGWGGLAMWLVVVGVAAAQVAMEWPRFQRGFDGILARENWLWLLGVWLVLKTWHEFAHGVFCRHFGAPVREVGVILILFMPIGYVDATGSLGLASKGRRMAVAAAGMYAEFFLAALCALVWVRTPEGVAATVLHNAIVTGTVVTFFFNANPLLRFDGYYLLSDWLELPNLALRGRQWVTRAAGWLLTGARALKPERPRTREQWLAAGYGVAAWFWQILVITGLLVAASALLRGGGLLLAAVALALWMGLPLASFASQIAGQLGHDGRRWLGLAGRLALLATLLAAVLLVPFRRRVTAPGVVELADTQAVRAECPGFVERVLVEDGQEVQAGDLLIELRNDEAAAELARAHLELARQEQAARLTYQRQDVAAFQAEWARVAAARRTVEERTRYVAALQVRAAFAGRVTGRQLAHLPGAYARTGDELCRLGRTTGHEVKLAVAQEAAPHFRTALGGPVALRLEGRAVQVPATLAHLEARATREVRHPELTALAGGPLALRRREPPGEGYELAEPHFEATARLATPLALLPGELAKARFTSARRVNLWELAHGTLGGWLERRAQPPGR